MHLDASNLLTLARTTTSRWTLPAKKMIATLEEQRRGQGVRRVVQARKVLILAASWQITVIMCIFDTCREGQRKEPK